MTTQPEYLTAADAFGDWRAEVLSGKPPTLFPVGTGDLARLEVGPGLVTLLGGAPGAGKTSFTMQAVVDALRITPTLRAVVCNVEMPPAVLLDRQLARLSGVDLNLIRHRRLGDEHAERLELGMNTIESFAERLAFVRSRFTLENLAATADAFGAELILLDYVQRITPPGDHADKRGSVNAMMDYLRRFADNGTAVIVISAVGRTKDSSGRSSYAGDNMNLASFRESSELEFGADDAFILTTDVDQDDIVTLRHLKSRHGECRDLTMTFHRCHQRFTPVVVAPEQQPHLDNGEAKAALAALWAQTSSADDDQEGEDE